jgi:Amt family ammonium transporter
VSHLYALGIVATFTVVGSYLLYMVTHSLIPMRVSEAEEEMGLDLSQHGESLEVVAPQETYTLPSLKVVTR